jgi:hypothetical protein
MNASYTGRRHKWKPATDGRVCPMCGIQERFIGKGRYYVLRLNPSDGTYLGPLANRYFQGHKMPPCIWGPKLELQGVPPAEEAVEGDW